MTALQVEPSGELLPGPAPVSDHSRFAALADARAVAWTTVDAVEIAGEAGLDGQQSHVRHVSLDGEWLRRATADDPLRPPVGAAFDDGEWDHVFVPDNFGLEPALSAHFGPVWYRRRLAPVDAPRVRLLFAAVDYLADVWLDEEHLGHHEGYFAPFSFDVTGRVHAGSVLTVRVQDPFEDLDPDSLFFFHGKRVVKGTLKYHDSRPAGLPGKMTPGWTAREGQSLTTGGITGGVHLGGTGDVQLDALFVTPLDDQTGVVQVAAVLTNTTSDVVPTRLVLRLMPPGSDGDWPAAAVDADIPSGAGRADLRLTLPGPLQRWWPRSHADLGRPDLYRLSATVMVDGVVSDGGSTRFGLRRATVDGDPKRLVVNGRPVLVQAANYIPRQHFADVDVEFYRRDMQLLGDAHLNSVGVHGHVQCPPCYDAADEEGILVFQDFALQWHYDSGRDTNPGFVDTACRQIAEMAYTYWNHPSIVYWACHNEPNAMFFGPKDPDPARDLDNQVLDEALELRLRQVEPLRHVHRASGIGDDLHLYDGSLSGGAVYDVRKHRSWFVSEYGFWTIGPQFARWNDQGWPPDEFQMKQWQSRLSFGSSTMTFTGLPERYPSLAAWAEATERYGAFLAKHQTEWFRLNRGDPFWAYRWHFFADWWGWAGGGLVDVDRRPKATYHALAAASRPLIALAHLPATVFEPGEELDVPVHVVNEHRRDVTVDVHWRWRRAAGSIVIGGDDVSRRGMSTWPSTEGVMVAVPWGPPGDVIAEGSFDAVVAAAESAREVGRLALPLPDEELRSATLELDWDDDEHNWLHALTAPAGWWCGPGAFVVTDGATRRLGS